MNHIKLFSSDDKSTEVMLFDNFFSAQQCQETVLYPWDWKRSMGFDYNTRKGQETDVRTSSSAYITPGIGPIFIQTIHSKISDLLKINPECCEHTQLTQYSVGQKYDYHQDFFTDQVTTNDRVGTFIIYLTDNFTGGHTSFQKLGMSVIPKVGRALYFKYETATFRDLTLHQGDPVYSDGPKIIATIWIRKNPIPKNEHGIQQFNKLEIPLTDDKPPSKFKLKLSRND